MISSSCGAAFDDMQPIVVVIDVPVVDIGVAGGA